MFFYLQASLYSQNGGKNEFFQGAQVKEDKICYQNQLVKKITKIPCGFYHAGKTKKISENGNFCTYRKPTLF